MGFFAGHPVLMIPILAVALALLIRLRSAHDGIKEFIATVLLACIPAAVVWFTGLLAYNLVREPSRWELWLGLVVAATMTYVLLREIWQPFR